MGKHDILVSQISIEISHRELALEWYKSYFNGKNTKVCISYTFSNYRRMKYGLPQDSVVGLDSFKMLKHVSKYKDGILF